METFMDFVPMTPVEVCACCHAVRGCRGCCKRCPTPCNCSHDCEHDVARETGEKHDHTWMNGILEVFGMKAFTEYQPDDIKKKLQL